MGGGEKLPDGATTFRYPEYDPTVVAFFEITAQSKWSDTAYDPEQAGKMLQDEQLVANASIAQIRTMLTYCTRGERFCDGHWGAMIEIGYVQRLLERLLRVEI